MDIDLNGAQVPMEIKINSETGVSIDIHHLTSVGRGYKLNLEFGFAGAGSLQDVPDDIDPKMRFALLQLASALSLYVECVVGKGKKMN